MSPPCVCLYKTLVLVHEVLHASMSSDAPCLHCAKLERSHHQAVSCDGCEGWVHRGCETGNLLISFLFRFNFNDIKC